MKKLIIGLTLVCVIIASVFSIAKLKAPAPAVSAQEIAAPEETAASDESAMPSEEADGQPEEEAAAMVLDHEAMRMSHDPDEVVLVTDGYEVKWSEFSYWLELIAEETEYYLEMYKMYGVDMSWEDFDQGGVDSAVEQLKSERAVELMAEEKGILLTEEEEQQLAEDFTAAVADEFGDASDENVAKYLEERNMTPEMKGRYDRVTMLYTKVFNETYGENGEKAADGDTEAYITEQGFLNANHILFMTIDPATGEDLDDAAKAEKENKAKEIAAELQAISDPAELLDRFAALKQELDEDTGKVSNPDGYLFTPGQMVEAFEQGTQALEFYQVSDPILSEYGYHVILRLPVTPDTVLSTDPDTGDTITLRMLYASNHYSDEFRARAESVPAERKPAFEKFTFLDFLKEA